MPADQPNIPRGNLRLNLVDFKTDDECPTMAVYLLDESFKTLHAADVNDDLEFRLPQKPLSAAAFVAIGPKVDDIGELDRKSLLLYRTAHFADLVSQSQVVNISKLKWIGWITVTRCVNGSVTRCYPYPWVIGNLWNQAAVLERSALQPRLPEAASGIQRDNLQLGNAIIDPIFPVFHKCGPVCDGLVEVYRRVRCCRPIIIDDFRIPEIVRDLEDLIPVPPIPDLDPFPPDPLPWEDLPFIKEGALDDRVLHARRHVNAIRRLSGEAQAAYINARPYLFCTHSSPTKVAQGFIQPHGSFHICWKEPLFFLLSHCKYQYAYVVKQVINGVTVTIYNGLAANQWFDYNDEPNLVSYHPQAIGCASDDVPGTGAFAVLQDVGSTASYHLKTPDATGWDRVAAPAYNDGLAFPVANPADAVGAWKNANWGGALDLRYHFSEALKGTGATRYRVSVVAADANGNPTGPRTYLNDGVTWRKYIVVGTNIETANEVLGPDSDGLFKIPYNADAAWQSGQYHAVLDTNRPEFSLGRYLLTLELFDAAGNQLKPNSAPATDPGNAAAFTFRRWFQETGPMAEVPFGALTHMLWWDNRKATATIVDLRVNGLPNTYECQFLEGPENAQFTSGYRAYHLNERFQLYHRMWSRRGLGGPVQNHTSPVYKPQNVGVPPAVPGTSNPITFADMLDGLSDPKCSFALNLRTYVKTFNGHHRLSGLDATDQAAFAMEIV